MPRAAAMTAFLAAAAAAAPPAPRPLTGASRIEAVIDPCLIDSNLLNLKKGELAEIEVLQQGVDLAIDLLSRKARLVTRVESPNGREGPEPVTVRAIVDGRHSIRVRPLSASEPRGRYRLTVVALRSVRATRRWLQERRRVRQ